MRKRPIQLAGISLLGVGGLIASSLLASAVGCRAPRTIRDPEFADLAVTPPMAYASPESVASAMMPVAADLSGPHPVDEYVAFAICQNPEIQVKRKRVEVAAMRVPQAASLDDPMLDVNGWPLYAHASQQPGGRMTVDVMASQQVPWFGKLRTRACAAEAEVDSARAELVAAELEVVEQVKRSYYELYLVQTALEISQQSRNLAVEFGRIAEVKYRTGLVDQQDLLRAQLEVSNVDVELVRMHQELQSAQVRLQLDCCTFPRRRRFGRCPSCLPSRSLATWSGCTPWPSRPALNCMLNWPLFAAIGSTSIWRGFNTTQT